MHAAGGGCGDNHRKDEWVLGNYEIFNRIKTKIHWRPLILQKVSSFGGADDLTECDHESGQLFG